MEKIKTYLTKTTDVVDKETGEVNTETKTYRYVEGTEEFFFIFAGCLNILERWDLSNAEIHLLSYLIRNYPSGQSFSITKNIKQEIAEKNNKSIYSYNNSTRKLLAKELIIKLDTKLYRLNPRFIWKGSTNGRKKAMIELSMD